MPRAFRFLLSSASLITLFLSAGPAEAQYLYLDSNGDGVHSASDVLSPTGTTTIDVWLRTDTNRDGSTAVCSSGDGELTINSYEFILRATNGTIAWGTLTNRQLDFTVSFGQASSATEFYGGFGGGAILPPGTYRLATLEVSVANGTPSLAPVSSSSLSAQHITAFGSRCSGNELDNTLRLDSDWFDVDGLPYGGVVNQLPTMSQPANMELDEGDVANQAITAIDLDGQPLDFTKVSGPFFMTVTTVDSGTGTASGNIRLAPLFTDAGNVNASVAVSDGVAGDQKTFQILVNNTSRFSFAAIPDMVVEGYGRATQNLPVQDPDVGVFTFSIVAGPSFMRLNTTVPAPTALVVLEPGLHDQGTFTATVAVSNGTETLTRTFQIVVTQPPPCGQGFCVAQQTYFGADIPIHLATGDVNGDSRPDLIWSTPRTVQASLGRGNGWFEPAVTTPVAPFPNIIWAFRAADLNRDGKADIVLTTSDQLFDEPTEIQILLGVGNGSFMRGDTYTPEGAFFRIDVGDLNGDGDPDIVVSPSGGKVTVLLGRGDGTFGTPTDWAAGTNPTQPVIADVNGDGRADLAVLDLPFSIEVLLGRGDGTFEPPTRTLLSTSQGNFLVSGDLNSDGHADFGFLGSQVIPGQTAIAFGGTGSLLTQTQSLRTLAGVHWGLSFTDMSGDGAPDAVLSISGHEALGDSPEIPGGISVAIGNGDGTFRDRTEFPSSSPFGYNSILAGDLNGDGRVDIAAVGDGPNLRVFLNRGYTPNPNRPPAIFSVSARTILEGSTGSATAFADDPDGDPITFFGVDRSSIPATIVVEEFRPVGDLSPLSLRITPGPGTAGDYSMILRAVAGGMETTWTIALHVEHVNRAPVADPGGPYAGVVGQALAFDGTGSQDPDGDPLTFAWAFGDGGHATGAEVNHAYAAAGAYACSLTVTDSGNPPLSAVGTTSATIAASLLGTAYVVGTSRTISLVGAAQPTLCVQVEPVADAFTPSQVDLNTLVMKLPNGTPGSEIHAISDRTTPSGDRDQDGIPELTACFRRADVRQLLSEIQGRQTVEVLIEGRLLSGAVFGASLELVVVGGVGSLSAMLAPNPMNPEAILSFVSRGSGPGRVDLFDLRGRLVRTLLDTRELTGGYHEVRVDGRDARGSRLASGVYFYRISTVGGIATGRFTILQ